MTQPMIAAQSNITVSGIEIGNDKPFVLFGGMNVLESRELAFEIAEQYIDICQRLNIGYVFKASFDKANRSSLHSFRGPSLENGLTWLNDIKETYNVPIITDVINVKKAQFLAPHEMRHIINKCLEAGNDQVILCERGSAFGYNNLVVDMLGFDTMKSMNVPVFFDVTHALQEPGARADSAGGRRHQITTLARAGMATGLAGLFLEAHPDQLEPFLIQIKQLDDLVKGFETLDTQ